MGFPSVEADPALKPYCKASAAGYIQRKTGVVPGTADKSKRSTNISTNPARIEN